MKETLYSGDGQAAQANDGGLKVKEDHHINGKGGVVDVLRPWTVTQTDPTRVGLRAAAAASANVSSMSLMRLKTRQRRIL